MGHFSLRLTLLLFSLIVIIRSSESAVGLSDFLPYGISVGDTRVPTGDDNSAGPVSLGFTFPFFEKRETIVYVNTNGAVSFGSAISQYTPTCGALNVASRMVAPFWADVDTSNGGDIYYRVSYDNNLLTLVSQEIAAAFPQLWGVEIKWLFITTWLEVAYYGCCSGCSDRTRRNNFQSILATDGTTSFAIFYYNKITWTTGTASGGNGCGLYGNPAKVCAENEYYWSIYCTLYSIGWLVQMKIVTIFNLYICTIYLQFIQNEIIYFVYVRVQLLILRVLNFLCLYRVLDSNLFSVFKINFCCIQIIKCFNYRILVFKAVARPSNWRGMRVK